MAATHRHNWHFYIVLCPILSNVWESLTTRICVDWIHNYYMSWNVSDLCVLRMWHSTTLSDPVSGYMQYASSPLHGILRLNRISPIQYRGCYMIPNVCCHCIVNLLNVYNYEPMRWTWQPYTGTRSGLSKLPSFLLKLKGGTSQEAHAMHYARDSMILVKKQRKKMIILMSERDIQNIAKYTLHTRGTCSISVYPCIAHMLLLSIQ